ncbi:MAG: hypothetical protein C0520_16980 [Sphingopyxis sp.]|nr:hypothetical protein [Sphingopyxis sp.]
MRRIENIRPSRRRVADPFSGSKRVEIAKVPSGRRAAAAGGADAWCAEGRRMSAGRSGRPNRDFVGRSLGGETIA